MGATPGKEVYAFSVPGSASEYACCDKAVASECYIIPTPGGLNPGETFDCTPTSRTGAAASEVSSPGSGKGSGTSGHPESVGASRACESWCQWVPAAARQYPAGCEGCGKSPYTQNLLRR